VKGEIPFFSFSFISSLLTLGYQMIIIVPPPGCWLLLLSIQNGQTHVQTTRIFGKILFPWCLFNDQLMINQLEY